MALISLVGLLKLFLLRRSTRLFDVIGIVSRLFLALAPPGKLYLQFEHGAAARKGSALNVPLPMLD